MIRRSSVVSQSPASSSSCRYVKLAPVSCKASAMSCENQVVGLPNRLHRIASDGRLKKRGAARSSTAERHSHAKKAKRIPKQEHAIHTGQALLKLETTCPGSHSEQQVSLARRLVRRREKSSSICASIREAWLQKLMSERPSPRIGGVGEPGTTARTNASILLLSSGPACTWVTSHPRALQGTRLALRAWHGMSARRAVVNSSYEHLLYL